MVFHMYIFAMYSSDVYMVSLDGFLVVLWMAKNGFFLIVAAIFGAPVLQVIEEARRKAAMLEKQTGEDGSKMAQRCGFLPSQNDKIVSPKSWDD